LHGKNLRKESAMGITFESSVSEIKGVGDTREKQLHRLGIDTVGDLVRHYPRAYQNRGDTKTVAEIAEHVTENVDSGPVSVILTVSGEPYVKMLRRGMNVLRFRAFDETGMCEITYFNQNYLKDVFHTGSTFRFWGKMKYEYGSLRMTAPAFEAYAEDKPLPPLVSVYGLSGGLKQKQMATLISEALSAVSGSIDEVIPGSVLREEGFCTAAYALRNIHMPESEEALERARRRLSFEDQFVNAAALASCRTRKTGHAIPMTDDDISPLLDLLPYSLTGAQKRSVSEIAADLSADIPMSRILTGDVGSGKTAVAAAAAYIAVKNGCQCALMVPTEILAVQHYRELEPLFTRLGLNCALLTGSTPAAQKKTIYGRLSGDMPSVTGDIDFIIGTHALLSEEVEFKRLGLVITDEQHRFGVMQRAALADKTEAVHTLVMSATPIPRTLSLVYYGDLAISKLDELPPGRKTVKTYLVNTDYDERIIAFIRRQAEDGHQSYVVCPAVEDTAQQDDFADDADELYNYLTEEPAEVLPMRSAVSFSKELALKLPDLKVGCVHGRMRAAEKDKVMRRFVDGEIDVLVSTTVIEVGVNVPAATLMVIENAERFGLSQLHQLRGRVGRGDATSYCVLVSDSKSETAVHRLETMKRNHDGYAIAEEDLMSRGPGDFFAASGALRQHGGAITADPQLTVRAVNAARRVVDADPTLSLPENQSLRLRVEALRRGAENTVS
jgi:ATP-dependent DNA helicase RecG